MCVGACFHKTTVTTFPICCQHVKINRKSFDKSFLIIWRICGGSAFYLGSETRSITFIMINNSFFMNNNHELQNYMLIIGEVFSFWMTSTVHDSGSFSSFFFHLLKNSNKTHAGSKMPKSTRKIKIENLIRAL